VKDVDLPGFVPVIIATCREMRRD